MSYPLFHESGPRTAPDALTPDRFAAEFPGESDFVEFKQGVPETKVREAVAAFSNSDGGIVLLGVRDDGVPVGVPTDGETVAKVHRIVSGVRNTGRYDLRPLAVGDKEVLVLAVRRRREGFAQLPDGRILVRRGAMNVALFDTDLARFVTSRALVRFESTAVEATLADADPDLVTGVQAVYGWSGEHLADRLHEVGLLVEPDPGSQLTVAGSLYLLPRPADVLGKAYVEIFRYRADAPTYDLRTEISGPVDRQVEQTTAALMAELGTDVVVLGVRRHELPRIPQQVLREAVANAVAHRTYETAGQPVRVEVHPDRVVVRSPGGLPEPVTLENLREQNAARNLDTIRLLRRFRLAEGAGLGVDVMQDAMADALLEPPLFTADATHVQVVLRLGTTATPQERAWLAEIERRGDIRHADRLLLLHAARGETLTNTSARELLGADSTHARAALQRLRNQGLLAQSGQRGGAVYVLAADLGPPAGLGLSPAELGDVVVALAQRGPVTNEDVREHTRLDRAVATRLLTELVDAGRLVRHGERRGTYYTAATRTSGSPT